MGQTDVHSLMKLFLSTSVLIQLTANILFVNTFLLQASNHHSHLDTNVEVDPHIGSAPVSRLLVELFVTSDLHGSTSLIFFSFQRFLCV